MCSWLFSFLLSAFHQGIVNVMMHDNYIQRLARPGIRTRYFGRCTHTWANTRNTRTHTHRERILCKSNTTAAVIVRCSQTRAHGVQSNPIIHFAGGGGGQWILHSICSKFINIHYFVAVVACCGCCCCALSTVHRILILPAPKCNRMPNTHTPQHSAADIKWNSVNLIVFAVFLATTQ